VDTNAARASVDDFGFVPFDEYVPPALTDARGEVALVLRDGAVCGDSARQSAMDIFSSSGRCLTPTRKFRLLSLPQAPYNLVALRPEAASCYAVLLVIDLPFLLTAIPAFCDAASGREKERSMFEESAFVQRQSCF
jgi:hypothetical protein